MIGLNVKSQKQADNERLKKRAGMVWLTMHTACW